MIRRGLGFLFLFFLFSSCGFSPSAVQGKKIAPEFVLESFKEPGTQVALKEWTDNHYVLLAFWASWCPPCIKEIPLLNDLNAQYASQGLKIFGINVEESRQNIEEVVQKQSVDYDILMDKDGSVAGMYEISGLPVIVLLAKGGQITYYGFSLPDLKDYFPFKKGA